MNAELLVTLKDKGYYIGTIKRLFHNEYTEKILQYDEATETFYCEDGTCYSKIDSRLVHIREGVKNET